MKITHKIFSLQADVDFIKLNWVLQNCMIKISRKENLVTLTKKEHAHFPQSQTGH